MCQKYDGKAKTSWDKCAWKPNDRVRALKQKDLPLFIRLHNQLITLRKLKNG